jgi:hypothetical protein
MPLTVSCRTAATWSSTSGRPNLREIALSKATPRPLLPRFSLRISQHKNPGCEAVVPACGHTETRSNSYTPGLTRTAEQVAWINTTYLRNQRIVPLSFKVGRHVDLDMNMQV